MTRGQLDKDSSKFWFLVFQKKDTGWRKAIWLVYWYLMDTAHLPDCLQSWVQRKRETRTLSKGLWMLWGKWSWGLCWILFTSGIVLSHMSNWQELSQKDACIWKGNRIRPDVEANGNLSPWLNYVSQAFMRNTNRGIVILANLRDSEEVKKMT